MVSLPRPAAPSARGLPRRISPAAIITWPSRAGLALGVVVPAWAPAETSWNWLALTVNAPLPVLVKPWLPRIMPLRVSSEPLATSTVMPARVVLLKVSVPETVALVLTVVVVTKGLALSTAPSSKDMRLTMKLEPDGARPRKSRRPPEPTWIRVPTPPRAAWLPRTASTPPRMSISPTQLLLLWKVVAPLPVVTPKSRTVEVLVGASSILPPPLSWPRA